MDEDSRAERGATDPQIPPPPVRLRKEGLNAISLLNKADSLESFIFSRQVGLPLSIPFLNFLTSFFSAKLLGWPCFLLQNRKCTECDPACMCTAVYMCIHTKIRVHTRRVCKSNCWYGVHIQIYMRLACLPEYVSAMWMYKLA